MTNSAPTKMIGLIAITVVGAFIYQTCYLPATADPIRHVAICGKDEFVVAGSFRRGRVEVWDLALTHKYSVPNERGRRTISVLKASKRLPIVCVTSLTSGGDDIDELFWLDADQSHRIYLSCDRIWTVVDNDVERTTDVVVSTDGKKSICRFRDSREFERIASIPEGSYWIGNGVGYRSASSGYFWMPHGCTEFVWLTKAEGGIEKMNLGDVADDITFDVLGFLPVRGAVVGMRSATSGERELCACSVRDDGEATWCCTPIESKDVPEFRAWTDFGVGVEHVVAGADGRIRVWRFGPDGRAELKAHRDEPL